APRKSQRQQASPEGGLAWFLRSRFFHFLSGGIAHRLLPRVSRALSQTKARRSQQRRRRTGAQRRSARESRQPACVEGGGQRRENEALGKEQTHHPAPPGANGDAQGDFAAAPGAAQQEQVTCDEQDKDDSREQAENRGPQIAGQYVANRTERDAEPVIRVGI